VETTETSKIQPRFGALDGVGRHVARAAFDSQVYIDLAELFSAQYLLYCSMYVVCQLNG
jgi:hypothetical protein